MIQPTAADEAAQAHLKPVPADFVAQSAKPMTGPEREAWLTDVKREMKHRGATHFRFSTHPDIPHLHLVEGWRSTPANEGDPRWALASGNPA